MPALNTAVSGLMMHQKKIDVIADNIANVNTISFKSSRAEFGDSFYQIVRAASSTQPVGIAVGTGGQINTISTVHSQGALSRTGSTFDLAMSGEGFFVVRDPIKDAIYFTRAGDFSVNQDGELINSLGYNVLGVVGDANSQDGDATDPELSAPTDVDSIIIPREFVSQTPEIQATGSVTVGNDLPDAGDTLVLGGEILTFGTDITIGSDAETTAANIVTAIAANAFLTATLTATQSGNVVSLVTKSSGSNTGAIGNGFGIGSGNATGSFTLTANPSAGETITINGVTYTFTAAGTTSSGTNIALGTTATLTARSIVEHLNTTSQKALTDVTAMFRNDGADGTTGNPQVILTAITQGTAGNAYAISDASAGITTGAATLLGAVTPAASSEIAFPPGSNNLLRNGADIGALQTESVLSVSVGSDGKVTLFGGGGTSRTIAWVTVAKFKSPESLQKIGNNLYNYNEAAGSFSGLSSFSITNDVRKPGVDGIGFIQSGALELSNVDISEQFTEMILTQRGFEANARVITTSDEMLQTVVNLRR